jgi:Na+/H+-dicarboxylate symporter
MEGFQAAILKYPSPTLALESRSDKGHDEIDDSGRGLSPPLISLCLPAWPGFVLTLGATANQNGTAPYEGITVLFLAQVFGVELSLAQQGMVVLMSVLAGIGTAGVPGGSLPLVAIVLTTVGVPAEGIGIILGVDRLLDMCRTTLNVAGDLVIAACVNRTNPPGPQPV